jgi:hypothetical protein
VGAGGGIPEEIVREILPVINQRLIRVAVQFDKEASPNARLLCRKKRDTPRGSPDPLLRKKRLLRMTNKLTTTSSISYSFGPFLWYSPFSSALPPKTHLQQRCIHEAHYEFSE